MKLISKEDGKKLNQIIPQYIHTTCHKRHYYIVENKRACKEYDKLHGKVSKNNRKGNRSKHNNTH